MRVSFHDIISPRKMAISVVGENRNWGAFGTGAAVGGATVVVSAGAAVAGAAAVAIVVGGGVAASVAPCASAGVGEAKIIIGACVGAAVPGMPQPAIAMAISRRVR